MIGLPRAAVRFQTKPRPRRAKRTAEAGSFQSRKVPARGLLAKCLLPKPLLPAGRSSGSFVAEDRGVATAAVVSFLVSAILVGKRLLFESNVEGKDRAARFSADRAARKGRRADDPDGGYLRTFGPRFQLRSVRVRHKSGRTSLGNRNATHRRAVPVENYRLRCQP